MVCSAKAALAATSAADSTRRARLARAAAPAAFMGSGMRIDIPHTAKTTAAPVITRTSELGQILRIPPRLRSSA
ncbi:MAG TPA: hypothetical protein VGG64_28745 [Pirellulales bacterium]